MPTQTTRLRPPWRTKMVLIIIGVAALGLWGLYDATVKYPARGEKVARLMEYRMLQSVGGPADNRRLIPARAVNVDEPEGELGTLIERESSAGLGEMEKLRIAWLRALRVIGRLSPEHTTYTDDSGARDPDTRLVELEKEWQKATGQPKLLHEYDIPVQWVIFGVCMLIVLWSIIVVLRTSSRRYTFDDESLALTLPGGQTITPTDLEDIDKRRWHKFYAALKIRPEHPALGGRSVDIDLYRRAFIEDWILKMEREAFPERVEESEVGGDDAAGEAPDDPAEA